MSDKLSVAIYSLKEKHVDAMMQIEESSTENYWTRNMYLKCASGKSGYGGLVACDNMGVVGGVGFESSYDELQIWNIVVLPRVRCRGVGTQLIGRLQEFVPNSYHCLKFNVRESNTTAHLFLRSCDFWCGAIANNYFKDKIKKVVTREHAYCFEFGQKVIKPKKIPVLNTLKQITIRPK